MNKVILIFFLLPIYAFSQNANRKFISHSQSGNRFNIETSDGSYRILFYTPEIVETSFIPTGETFNSESHAVVLEPSTTQITFSETEAAIKLLSNGITVEIGKSPFQITYFHNGQKLVSEKAGYSKSESGEQINFNLDTSEALFGGGARVLGMNRRGNRLQLYNRAHYGYGTRSELMNFTIPMVLSSKIYAIHFDNAPIGYLDLDSKNNNTLTYETISGRKTYQVIAGNTWDNLIENYTLLTGRQPLPPRWAFGNFASRFGYHSEREVRETVAKFKADKIPLDAIILDLYWFGKEVKGTMGNLAFDRDSFPNPEAMMADFSKHGIKTVLVTEPFILTTSNRWNEAVSKQNLATDSIGNPFTYDFYFGNTGLIDIFKPEGHDWFWDIYKNLTKKGVSGWWGDLGEPEVHPSELQHAAGSADEVHNIYGHNWAKLVFDGYKKDFPEQRPFILMRSGYSGSQRFGLIPWSGDVSRSWDGLSGQPEISLQMGMQGLAYMHSDLGGFAGDYRDSELYTRWLQYGVFQPVFRPHAQEEVPAEPVFWDEKTKELAKKAIELRYKLMPYNYTIAFQNNQKGTPLMRPLFFEEPQNADLLQIAETYLWGDNLLISPVLLKGASEKQIYFPKSANWYDFYNDAKYNAGSTVKIPVTLDHIPVFVRGGAFIPMAKLFQTTADYSTDNLDLHFWFDDSVKTSSGFLYDDDGSTPNAFEKGKSAQMRFRSKLLDKNLVILIDYDSSAASDSATKKINLVTHNLSKKPRKVIVGDKKAKFKWNRKNRRLEVEFDCASDSPKEIKITL